MADEKPNTDFALGWAWNQPNWEERVKALTREVFLMGCKYSAQVNGGSVVLHPKFYEELQAHRPDLLAALAAMRANERRLRGR